MTLSPMTAQQALVHIYAAGCTVPLRTYQNNRLAWLSQTLKWLSEHAEKTQRVDLNISVRSEGLGGLVGVIKATQLPEAGSFEETLKANGLHMPELFSETEVFCSFTEEDHIDKMTVLVGQAVRISGVLRDYTERMHKNRYRLLKEASDHYANRIPFDISQRPNPGIRTL